MGWRGKLVCLLIFYFAGFATAIYCLAPVSPEQAAFYASKGFPYTATKSDQFAKSFSVSLRKGIDYTKNTAVRTADYLKQKADGKTDPDVVNRGRPEQAQRVEVPKTYYPTQSATLNR